MHLRCPQCGYQGEIETGGVPIAAVRVVCPGCGREFAVETATESFTFTPAGEEQSAALASSPADAAKAGFWLRVVAALIDSALLTAAQLVLGALFGVILALLIGGYDSDSLAMLAVVWLFGSTLGLAYYVFFTAHGGQTPGKMALRIKVIRTDGTEIGLGKAFYREAVCKFLSALIFGIGYLMVAFDEKKQGLHDRMAGTYVIKL